MEPEKTGGNNQHQPVSRRQIALFRTWPIVLFTVLFGAVILFLVLRTAGGLRRSEEVVTRFAPLAHACDGGGIDAATPYTEESGLHPVVSFRRLEGAWVLDPTLLPTAWFPAAAADTELVLCLGERSALTAPRCSDTSGEPTPTRVYGYRLPLRLVDAHSGELIVEDVLNSAPRTLSCWEADAEPAALGVSAEQIRSRIRLYVDLP